MLSKDEQKQQHKNISVKTIERTFPWAYFDGSAQQDGCGEGVVLHLSEDHYFKIKMGLGRGTNNYLELNSLRLLLIFSLEKGCRQL